MSRASLIALTWLLSGGAAFAAPPCGEQLLAFNTYEVMVEGETQARFSLFPLPEWSDASAFKGVVTKTSGLTLEVELEGKKKEFDFEVWEKDPAYFAATEFKAKKFFKNKEYGAHFTLRLKQNEKVVCEERREISGD